MARYIWSVGYDGYSVIPRPVYAEGLVFLSTSYNNAVAMAISPEGQGDVTETNVAWENRQAAPHTPSMLVVGKEVYMVSDRGIASCADAKTGKVHWQQRLGGNYLGLALYGDGKIYFQSEGGEGIVIQAGHDVRGTRPKRHERPHAGLVWGDRFRPAHPHGRSAVSDHRPEVRLCFTKIGENLGGTP